jgi:hypothetical protein
MEIKLFLKIDHIQEKEYEGKKILQIQTIQKSENKGFEIVKVKLTDEAVSCKVGDYVSLPVRLSAMNSQIFYTQNGKIETVKGQ